ncbi:MAG: glycosyltransferase family 4 protein [Gaiellaceae bacterium]
MKVTISVGGKFEAAYRWGRYLEDRGELERLVTTLPFFRVRHFGVSAGRTTSISMVGWWNYLIGRTRSRAVMRANQLGASALFDRLASRRLGDCDVFNGWTSMALCSIRAARSRGVPTILHTGSAHIAYQTELLEEEYERYGEHGWQTHRGIVARTLEEYEEADAIVVPSTFVLRTFADRAVDRQKLFLVPETAVAATPQPTPYERASHEPPTILFVGRAELRKGLPYLLDAFRKLGGAARLRLVGEAPSAKLLERLGGLPAGVDVVGVQRGEALQQEFRRADIVVLPSVEDGFGLAAAEAMAAGIAVIVSDHAGSADLIDDGTNGLIVPARNADALAEAMERLLVDEELRRRLGVEARVARRDRTWQHYGDDLHAVFSAVCGGTASPETR